jgi:UDP-2,3-diacylglucosamine hydrolase
LSLIAISDLHLNPQAPQRATDFLKFLRQAADSKDDVLIAGDLFDLWLGPAPLTFAYQAPILRQMEGLVASGLRLYYVEGNRDFAVSDSWGMKLFSGMAAETLRLQHERWTLKAVHGDLINREDRLYRFWRALSKNRLSLFLLKKLPPRFVQKSSEKMERELKPTNRKHKSYFPEKHVEAFIREAATEGYNLVIAGHFHIEREIEIQWQGRSVLFYSLPGWEHGLRYLVIPEDGARPYFRGN